MWQIFRCSEINNGHVASIIGLIHCVMIVLHYSQLLHFIMYSPSTVTTLHMSAVVLHLQDVIQIALIAEYKCKHTLTANKVRGVITIFIR